METESIKTKIVAQYWGQKVLYVGGVGLVVVGKGGWNLSHPDFFLQLKSVSNISNEDAIEVGKLMNLSHLQPYSNLISLVKNILDNWNIQGNVILWLKIYQYLQSKGYALPYMEYSVDDLVKAGIYKLID